MTNGFCSTSDTSLRVSLKEAVLQNVPKDGGLFMPALIPSVPPGFVSALHGMPYPEIAFKVLSVLLEGEIEPKALEQICHRAFSFDAKLHSVTENIYCLELFHGPTLAFKDFGVRFMAELLTYYLEGATHKTTILTATSGDTGGAVASAFFKRSQFEVYILYPKGKISGFQEEQIAGLGENIYPIEVDGSFDDCQRLVKQALVDPVIGAKRKFCSANSINIARLLPQVCYYFKAVSELAAGSKQVVFSVPSGNFGNLTAGVLAKKMGLAVARFVAATNINDVVPRYLQSGRYIPGQFHETLSSAMDIADPNNFTRTQFLYGNSIEALKKDIAGYAFTDDQTKAGLKMLYDTFDYLSEPHAVIAYLGLCEELKHIDATGVFLGTAHPVKFQEIVQEVIGHEFPGQEEKKAYTTRKNMRSIDMQVDALRAILSA